MATNETIITPEHVLDLARQLAPEQQRWLVITIQQELDADLPDHTTIDEALALYLADRCSLGRAAELAAVTQWDLKRILADRSTPARATNDYASVEELDAQADAAWAQIDGR